MPSNRFQTVCLFQPTSLPRSSPTRICSRCAAAAATLATISLGTPAAVKSSGVAMTVSSKPRSPLARACTNTFDASSAVICFQPTICPLLIFAIRVPPGVEPAAFVEAAVAVEVFLAVDLESVLIIAPLCRCPAAMGHHEPSQQFALPVAQDIADAAVLVVYHALDFAGVHCRRVGGRVVLEFWMNFGINFSSAPGPVALFAFCCPIAVIRGAAKAQAQERLL